jgi:amidohydrolase
VLSQSQIAELTALRHALHRRPDLSGDEAATAARVADLLAGCAPDHLWTGLGGHGVAAQFRGALPGPRVLLRCELDGLPIQECPTGATQDWASEIAGQGHLCGHDGHMVWLLGVARILQRQRPARGSVILMFQPAEETGAGAAAVVADPAYADLRPDFAYAIHNLPGLALGEVAVIAGPTSCASRGMRIALQGRTAHASQPDTGLSPMAALARLMPALTALSKGTHTDPDFALATVTHTRMGAPAFGVVPGEAELFVTLRTLSDAAMSELQARAESLVRDTCAAEGLEVAIRYEDIFAATVNSPRAVAELCQALEALGVRHGVGPLPFRASEDFGGFACADALGAGPDLALLFLGAGVDCPALHNPDYDFPDGLIVPGIAILVSVLDRLLGLPGAAPRFAVDFDSKIVTVSPEALMP